MTARAEGGLPERVPPPLPDNTTVLSGSSTSLGLSSVSISPASVSAGDTQQNGNQSKGSPTKVIAIVGATGGLVLSAVVGVGAWIFLRRRRVPGKEIDENHPGDPFMSEHDLQPPQIRIYVSCFALPPDYFSDRH